MAVANAYDRCWLFRDVMGTQFVSELLAFSIRREHDFMPATVYGKADGSRVDTNKRDCLVLLDLGALRPQVEHMIKCRVGPVAAAFGFGADLIRKEFEICAYGHGGAFKAHVDAFAEPARRLTCVYYFSRMPRPFTGGQLRLYPWPVPLTAASRKVLDVEPECDSMVLFPSILQHEVLPVGSAKRCWSDRRFSLTCWLWGLSRAGTQAT